jgi:hypothetical protein
MANPSGYQTEAQQAADGNASPTEIQGGNTVTVSANRLPSVTTAIANPMHRYASWTYSWSLWWLDPFDYNALATQDASVAKQYTLSQKSFVVAEDGGRDTGRRAPSQFGLNYQLQDLAIKTSVGLSQFAKSGNNISGSFTVIEPYGVTFLDTLISLSWDGTRYTNYTEQPYLIQIDFKGYDDNGDPVPDTELAVYSKRFPITFKNIACSVTNKGSEYKVDFAPCNYSNAKYVEECAYTPADFNFTAGTVDEFFKEFAKQFNRYYQNEVYTNRAQFANSITFDVDPAILKSSIVNPLEAPLTQADPNTNDITLSKTSWSIPRGTNVQTVIDKVMYHSSFLVNDQLGLEKPKSGGDQTQPTVLYKTLVAAKFIGTDASGTAQEGSFDNYKNARPMALTYRIFQFTSWKGAHPASAGTMPDPRNYNVKIYDYIYSGKNIDVVDLKINLNNAWRTIVQSYTEAVAATQASAATGNDIVLTTASALALTPSALGTTLTPLQAVGVLTPWKISHGVADPNTSVVSGERPAAKVVGDVVKAFRSDTQMLDLKLTIVGDPYLLKQDDWLYVPSPNLGVEYNKQTGQADFAKKFGHLRMDTSELAVAINIRTPLDIDTDWTNTGLMFPTAKMATSAFSGQYFIREINSRFSQGKFEQVLSMGKYLNASFAEAFASTQNNSRSDTNASAGTVGTSQSNQSSSVQTNSSTSTTGTGTSTIVPER